MAPICFTIPHLLSLEECRDFIEWGEREHYQHTGRDYPADYRDNDRLVALRETLAKQLWSRLQSYLPERIERAGAIWVPDSLNPQFRGCRYRGGQSFTRHRDGAYSPDEQRMSLLTVMLYLNDHSEFRGGSTRFYGDRYSPEAEREILPQTGMGILFDHHHWHDGQAVTEGTKYVLRTDVVYRLESGVLKGHRGYVWDLESLGDGCLASGSRDRTVRIWSAGDVPSERQVLTGHQASVTSLTATPHGFASGGRDRVIIDWRRDLYGDYCKARLWRAHEGALLKLVSLPDGRLLSAAADNTVKLWSSERTLLATLKTDGWPWAVVKDGDGFLVGTESGALIGVDSHLEGQQTVYQHPSPIRAALVLADGQLAARWAIGDAKGAIVYLNAQHRPVRTVQAHRGSVTCLVQVGRWVVSGGEDDGVMAWLGEMGTQLWNHRDFVRALCLQGDRLVSASYDGSLQLSKPSAIWRTAPAADPGGTRLGTVAAS